MYLISEHSSFNEWNIYGTLIGIHENYLYSGNSFEEELQIYRRKIAETGNWELFWNFEISSRSNCFCSNDTVSAAFGIINDQLFVAAFGVKPNDDEIKLNISSINLIREDITDYKTDPNITADISKSLCNQCCLSSITALNPQNPNEICIIPWSPEPMSRFSTLIGAYTDSVQTKLKIDPETKVCSYLGSAGFQICKQSPIEQSLNSSNIGVLEFGKVVFFRENDLILAETTETKLEIVEDSDLQECVYAGFYSTPQKGLECIAFQKAENQFEQICSLFNVIIDKEKNQAKFTKIHTFPSHLLPSDPRLSRFILDSRMFICSYQDYTFSYIFGMLSLSEISYISASNFYSPIFQEYQKYAKIEKPKFGDRSGILRESKNLGLTQNGIKQLLKLPKSFEFWIR